MTSGSACPPSSPWRPIPSRRWAAKLADGGGQPGRARGAGHPPDGDGYDFCVLHGDRPAVRVDVASGWFSRLVICVPEGADPEVEAARIAALAGITPSAPAS